MKKVLVILALVGVLLFAMSGMAFAGTIGQIGLGNVATQFQVVSQTAFIRSNSTSISGPAVGIGFGNVVASSGPATAVNAPFNTVTQAVIQ
jgi:hypothetical protein